MKPLDLPIPLDCPHTAKPDTPHLKGICADCNELLVKWMLENAWGYCMTCAVRRGPRLPPQEVIVTTGHVPAHVLPRRGSITPLKAGYE